MCGSIEGDPPAGESFADGIRVVRYRIPRVPFSPARWPLHLASARTAVARHLSGPWDVLSTHSPAAALALRDVRARWHVHTVHSPLVDEQRINWGGSFGGLVKRSLGVPFLRAAERRVLLGVNHVHVLSAFTAERLVSEHGEWVQRKLTILPWWADDVARGCPRQDARRALGLPPTGTLLCSIRRLVPRMGLDVLIHAMGRLNTSHRWTLAIAGAGPERSRLERLAVEQGIRERIWFLGRISDADRSMLYDAADLVVVPSRALECFGLVVLEALARGVPVLASSVGAIPEVLQPVLPDALFPANDPDALAAKLDRTLGTGRCELRDETLRARVRERFGSEQLHPKYVALLTPPGA